MILYSMRYDPYDISAEKSDRYGRMFLENLAIVDTFMTDAAHDYVVYSPTLPSQFGGNRFTNYVRQISTGPGDSARRYGSFTVDYTENAVPALQHSPDSRTVSWRYYGESGHAVSASQPEEFRDDVAFWLQHRWYNVYPREGSVTGSTEVTLYGENLCVDSNEPAICYRVRISRRGACVRYPARSHSKRRPCRRVQVMSSLIRPPMERSQPATASVQNCPRALQCCRRMIRPVLR